MLRTEQRVLWRRLALVHRLEFPLPFQYLCYAVWGACYAVDDARQLLEPPVLLAIAANLLLVVALNALNAAVDIHTDAQTPDKQGIATAVLALGSKRTVWWSVAEMTLAAALSTVASALTGRWLVTGAVVLTIALHLLYNLEPTRLKRRALANPITLGLSLGFVPAIASYSATQATFTVPGWLLLASLGVLITARTWWWSVPDRVGDVASGMMTPAARYGASRTLAVSCLLTGPGLLLLGTGLWSRYGLGWAVLGVLVYVAFLIDQLVLLRRVRDGAVPTSASLRRRSVPLAILANAVLVTIPLVAG